MCVVCICVLVHEYAFICREREMEMCMCVSIGTDLMNIIMKIIWKAHLFQLVWGGNVSSDSLCAQETACNQSNRLYCTGWLSDPHKMICDTIVSVSVRQH